MRPSLTWPKPWPPRSGGRWAAHRPRSLTCSRSGSIARSKPSWPSSSNTVSIGQISSRTNSRIQSSCCWNSGSVEKSHAIAYRLLRFAAPQGIDAQLPSGAPVDRCMKPLAAVLALIALLIAAAPAAAEERLASESRPFTADAFGDVVAWSALRRGGAGVPPAGAARRRDHDAGRRRLPRRPPARRRPGAGRRAARRLLAPRRHLPVRPRDRARAAAGRGQHARHRAAPEPPPQRRSASCAASSGKPVLYLRRAATRSASRARASSARSRSRTSS